MCKTFTGSNEKERHKFYVIAERDLLKSIKLQYSYTEEEILFWVWKEGKSLWEYWCLFFERS